MTVVGNDISILIDGEDYTDKITTYSDSGGEKTIIHKRVMGNKYKNIVTGRADYSLTIQFKQDDIDIDTMFEDDSGVDIDIVLGSEATVSYTNMIPQSFTNELSPESVAYVTIIYSASAYDVLGNTNREVL